MRLLAPPHLPRARAGRARTRRPRASWCLRAARTRRGGCPTRCAPCCGATTRSRVGAWLAGWRAGCGVQGRSWCPGAWRRQPLVLVVQVAGGCGQASVPPLDPCWNAAVGGRRARPQHCRLTARRCPCDCPLPCCCPRARSAARPCTPSSRLPCAAPVASTTPCLCSAAARGHGAHQGPALVPRQQDHAAAGHARRRARPGPARRQVGGSTGHLRPLLAGCVALPSAGARL